ncbi:glycosyltransferase family 2 protein [bacterium]|nr:glycosyltransferase family 2 protein [bacterium]
MQLSIIIPTYNRAEILKDCLRRLNNQDFIKNEFEVIVVDDGSTDNTKEVVKNAQKKSSVEINYLYQKNQGQGVARNYALRYAKGRIIVFIGDDILVLPDFVKQHLNYHRRYRRENEAVLGFIGWDPRLEVTPFMEWLTNGSSVFGRFGGHQFAFEKLQGKKKADFNFFYTSNISLKKSLLKRHPFDSKFSSYGWEDIELGYRLTKKENLILYYNPMAIGYHFHEMDESGFEKRMYAIGKSAHLFHKKYPELKKVPQKWKQIIFSVISSKIVLGILKKFGKNTLYYYALSKKYYLEGIRNGAKA